MEGNIFETGAVAKKKEDTRIEGKENIISEKNEKSPEQLKKDWEDFYREIGIEADLSDVEIPEKREGFEKLLIMAKGLTPQKLFDKPSEFCPTWKYIEEDLDKIITSDRSAKEKAYAVWVRDRIEADKEHEVKNRNDNVMEIIKEKKIIAETLEERLLQEIEFFKKTGEHLDNKTITLCVGSCISDRCVPGVYFYKKVRVDDCYPVHHDYRFRVREAVCAEGAK